MSSPKPEFYYLVRELEDIKPMCRISEDYKDWQAVYSYVLKNWHRLEDIYNKVGIKSIVEILYDADIPHGFLAQAYSNLTLY